MGETNNKSSFTKKFNMLSEHNKQYVIGIQQALMYAQRNIALNKDKNQPQSPCGNS